MDPVGVNAESLSSGFSHPDLEYNHSGSRGFPHPIPYGAYHPFTPINCGGHGCQVSINGGGIPFPVLHSIHHGGVTLNLLGCHVPSAGVPPFVFGGANVPGAQGLGGYSHVPSSVASSFGALSSMLHPLLHQDARSMLDSNVSQSFGLPVCRSTGCHSCSSSGSPWGAHAGLTPFYAFFIDTAQAFQAC